MNISINKDGVISICLKSGLYLEIEQEADLLTIFGGSEHFNFTIDKATRTLMCNGLPLGKSLNLFKDLTELSRAWRKECMNTQQTKKQQNNKKL